MGASHGTEIKEPENYTWVNNLTQFVNMDIEGQIYVQKVETYGITLAIKLHYQPS